MESLSTIVNKSIAKYFQFVKNKRKMNCNFDKFNAYVSYRDIKCSVL